MGKLRQQSFSFFSAAATGRQEKKREKKTTTTEEARRRLPETFPFPRRKGSQVQMTLSFFESCQMESSIYNGSK